MLRAFLDEYNLIVVYMSKKHYLGISNLFYLKDENAKKVELSIINSVDEDIQIKYYLSCPDLNIGANYIMFEEHGFNCGLQYRFIVKDPRFDRDFNYQGPLGAFVVNNKTSFFLFAPTANEVIVKLFLAEEIFLKMKRIESGVFHLNVEQNLTGTEYRYLVKVNNVINETIDPYALGTTANGKRSVIVDKNIFQPTNKFINKKMLPIIYEVNVRDMTVDKNAGNSQFVDFALDKKGFALDYISSLGVSYIQLMPVVDFASIDEDGDDKYNWGYDPLQFFVPEGSYSSDANDYQVRIKELKSLVDKVHAKNIGVILDVVYNHVYNYQNFSYELIVPYYFFRYDEHNNMSNGSFCHNDVDSERPMVRRLIIDSLMHWCINYSIDGFRFDLLGILDIQTVKQIIKQLKAINPNIILLAEGWNMPTALDEKKRATMQNQEQIPEMAFFNDRFRDCLRGNLWSRTDRSGYLFSNNINGTLKNILTGSCTHIGASPLFDNSWQSVNYVESHDNSTLRDKIAAISEDNDINKIIKLANALVLFSQGIPFFHAGQECGGSKQGHDNSYNLPDEINKFDYRLKEKNSDLVNYFIAAIRIRKQERLLNLSSAQEIVKKCFFIEEQQILLYVITDEQEQLNIYINPSNELKKITQKGRLIFDSNGANNEEVLEFLLPAISLAIVKISKE